MNKRFKGIASMAAAGVLALALAGCGGGGAADSGSAGTDKGAEYGKNSAGEVFNEDYYKKAQAAVASYQEYSDNLTKVGDPAKVDVITGATVAHQQFVQAAIRAIAAAQGVSPDGADDINIPGLNDATKDGDLDKDLGGSDG